MAGIAAIIGFGFFIIGIVYGYATGSIKKTSDIPDMMGKGLLPFVPVIVLFFAASQFLALFKMSSLGEILAIREPSSSVHSTPERSSSSSADGCLWHSVPCS
ncbi:AbgT family transporter [Brevibacterium sp. UCMA 11754]|uniref:AbgT family transporter n=1 Tax=Brevibacterium sp. UCMA 11754 TaxID=2749198 RepID=UPI002285E297|nr:AbgT family transporter [Brevibacterium sp. UCMA 11754]